jgi:ATP-dependent protease ClpP protease subunit
MNKIHIYDNIGFEGITAKDVADELANLDGGAIEVHINSGGGSVSQGIAIYNQLKAYTGKVTVHVDGLAASIASVIAMAADELIMAEGSLMMIHSAWSMVAGNAEDLRKEAEVLDVHDKTIREIYGHRTERSDEVIEEMMVNETWMDGAEAILFGFADSLGGELRAAASVDFSKFNKAPERIQSLLKTLSEVTDAVKAEEADETPQKQDDDVADCLAAKRASLAVMEKLGELSL